MLCGCASLLAEENSLDGWAKIDAVVGEEQLFSYFCEFEFVIDTVMNSYLFATETNGWVCGAKEHKREKETLQRNCHTGSEWNVN